MGAFDAFLYVPDTPPATPSPTKKAPRTTPLFLAPRLADLSPIRLEVGDDSNRKRKRSTNQDKDVAASPIEPGRRRSPRLKTPLIASPPTSPVQPTAEPLAPNMPLVIVDETRKKKKRKAARPYADPSLYAHLPQHLSDVIQDDLILLLVGLNPGVMTAQTGHHFANPTNLFWPLLYSSGIISEPLKASASHLLPQRYRVGITNIVGRPTAEGGELSKEECVEGSKRLIGLVKRYKPRAIALTGKGIWDAMFRALHDRPIRKNDEFRFGWQTERIVEQASGWSCPIFVTMGTSGRVAAYSPAYKKEVFGWLGDWVKDERSKSTKLSAEISEDTKRNEPLDVVICADNSEEEDEKVKIAVKLETDEPVTVED